MPKKKTNKVPCGVIFDRITGEKTTLYCEETEQYKQTYEDFLNDFARRFCKIKSVREWLGG